jgi:DNA-binding LytR/AlgR family response regulator
MHSALEEFIRVHRGHLVNRNFINGYTKGKGGGIQLQNDEQVDVSK